MTAIVPFKARPGSQNPFAEMGDSIAQDDPAAKASQPD